MHLQNFWQTYTNHYKIIAYNLHRNLKCLYFRAEKFQDLHILISSQLIQVQYSYEFQYTTIESLCKQGQSKYFLKSAANLTGGRC